MSVSYLPNVYIDLTFGSTEEEVPKAKIRELSQRVQLHFYMGNSGKDKA